AATSKSERTGVMQPVAPDEAPALPPGRGTDLRWIYPVVAVVAAVALLAFLIPLIAHLPAHHPKSHPQSTSSGAGGPRLSIQTAHDFDPFPGDGTEHPELVPDAYDGNPSTSWRTQDYFSSFQSLGKPGV